MGVQRVHTEGIPTGMLGSSSNERAASGALAANMCCEGKNTSCGAPMAVPPTPSISVADMSITYRDYRPRWEVSNYSNYS